MVALSSGLIVTPVLTQTKVSIDMHFEPSVGLLARKVDKLGMDIRSFREPLKRIVQQVMIPSIRTNFDVGGRPGWAPLAPSTLQKKKGTSILIESAALRRTATTLGIWTIDREKAMVTDLPANVWYGKVHQAGAGAMHSVQVKKALGGVHDSGVLEGGEGAIPARPFIMVQPEDVDRMEQVMQMWLGERIVAAGLG